MNSRDFTEIRLLKELAIGDVFCLTSFMCGSVFRVKVAKGISPLEADSQGIVEVSGIIWKMSPLKKVKVRPKN